MDKTLAAALLAKLQTAGDVTMRPMMGGYVLYYDGTVIGQFNDGNVYIKNSAPASKLTAELSRQAPYDGAKPGLLIPVSKLDDPVWVRDVLELTKNHLTKK